MGSARRGVVDDSDGSVTRSEVILSVEGEEKREMSVKRWFSVNRKI